MKTLFRLTNFLMIAALSTPNAFVQAAPRSEMRQALIAAVKERYDLSKMSVPEKRQALADVIDSAWSAEIYNEALSNPENAIQILAGTELSPEERVALYKRIDETLVDLNSKINHAVITKMLNTKVIGDFDVVATALLGTGLLAAGTMATDIATGVGKSRPGLFRGPHQTKMRFATLAVTMVAIQAAIMRKEHSVRNQSVIRLNTANLESMEKLRIDLKNVQFAIQSQMSSALDEIILDMSSEENR